MLINPSLSYIYTFLGKKKVLGAKIKFNLFLDKLLSINACRKHCRNRINYFLKTLLLIMNLHYEKTSILFVLNIQPFNYPILRLGAVVAQ